MRSPKFIGATGRLIEYVPPGEDRDELLNLVRLGVVFRAQHRGRQAGFLHQYIRDLINRIIPPITFCRVLEELELEAARRNLYGETASPIEKVDRVWDLVTYHHPRKGRQQVTFKTVRNYLTACKKC